MAKSINTIKAPIVEEMKVFEQKFKGFTKSNVFLLNKITNYVIKRKGKQMRPMFVFLMAGTCGQISDITHRGAALVELLHTATLVHDDVVDDSNYRRGFFSINALWKNKAAVLVGDYLLSRGLLLSIDNGDFDLLRIVSQAVREMSEGELLQMEKTRGLDITEEIYFEIIRQKTATLISSCCAVGASSVKASEEIIKKSALFGEKIGMAFQIKDDLFDYGTAEIGKPLGIDIKEKKMTLPLIHALSQTSKSEKRNILSLIKNHSHKPAKVQEVIEFVKKSEGIEYTKQAMKKYYDEAMEILSTYPDSKFKTSLGDLVEYAIVRKK
jgi:octaprenyl-diphosphate synthase